MCNFTNVDPCSPMKPSARPGGTHRHPKGSSGPPPPPPPSSRCRAPQPAHVLCRFQRRGIVEHGGFFSPSPRGARRAGSGHIQVRLLQGSGRHGVQEPLGHGPGVSVTPGAGVRSPGRCSLPRLRTPNRPPKQPSPCASPAPSRPGPHLLPTGAGARPGSCGALG